ncbi:hypothetical protein J6TS7_29440 [Paenibacillus dendritiformis]|uniref:helix-turn-helix domain-containing protein n=1 Tax=Paenibacillus TaxID=44249 RepID=UPI001B1A78A8|nr:helix-turn-helix domain-containing protein [Paenibacillus dendritiformis]GIO79334.1 hypothetical protein J6TS7_29440 [Paenibacillus dendritiformis]
MQGKKIPEEDREKIVRLLRGGHELNQVAQLTGVHRQTVYNIKNQVNLTKIIRNYNYLNKKKVISILEDIKDIEGSRRLTQDDIKRLARKHGISESSLHKVKKRGLGAVSSKRRRITPRKLQTIYKSLESGDGLTDIAKKTGIPRSIVEYYKGRYNRGKDIRTCLASDCKNTFIPRLDGKPKLYCSTRCRDREKQRRYRTLREKKNLCPQCGGEWVEPESTHRGKPNHCLHCQVYYHDRYEKSRKD